jgi:hypothetical protein
MVPTKNITINEKTYRFGELTVKQTRDLSSISHKADFNLYIIATALNNGSVDGEPYTAEQLRRELSIQASLELFTATLEFSGMPVNEALRKAVADHVALVHAGALASGFRN